MVPPNLCTYASLFMGHYHVLSSDNGRLPVDATHKHIAFALLFRGPFIKTCTARIPPAPALFEYQCLDYSSSSSNLKYYLFTS